MKIARELKGCCVLLLICSGFITGCNSGPEEDGAKLKIGTVDIIRVMEERPETMAIRLDWSQQAGNAYLEISGVSDMKEARALEQEIAKRSKVWEERMDAFMEESVALVETEAEKLAKERGLDLVLVDNPMADSIQYREGEDLTLDVSLKLQSRE